MLGYYKAHAYSELWVEPHILTCDGSTGAAIIFRCVQSGKADLRLALN